MEKYQFTRVGRKRKNTLEIHNKKANNKMAVVSPYISIITLSINGLNSIKRYRMAG